MFQITIRIKIKQFNPIIKWSKNLSLFYFNAKKILELIFQNAWIIHEIANLKKDHLEIF